MNILYNNKLTISSWSTDEFVLLSQFGMLEGISTLSISLSSSTINICINKIFFIDLHSIYVNKIWCMILKVWIYVDDELLKEAHRWGIYEYNNQSFLLLHCKLILLWLCKLYK